MSTPWRAGHFVIVCALLAPACGGPNPTNSDGSADGANPADVHVPGRDLNAIIGTTPVTPENPGPTTNCAATLGLRLATTVLDSTLDNASVSIAATVADDGRAPQFRARPVIVQIVEGGRVLALVTRNEGVVAGSSVDTRWNGTVDGVAVAPGDYTVRATYECGADGPAIVREAPLTVVRLGAVRVTVADGDGLRIPLLWPRMNNVRRNYWLPANTRAVVSRGRGAGAADLVGTDGTRLTIPRPFADLESPPLETSGLPLAHDYNQPIALQIGTHPDVTVLFARSATSATLPAIRARIDNATPAADTTLAAITPLMFRLDMPPAPHFARYDFDLRVHYEALAEGGSYVEIGGESIPLRVYGLLGDQTISTSVTAPYGAWVPVVDAVTGWVHGTTDDPDEISGEIVRHVLDDFGLRYDTVNGASFYTGYGTSTYGFARFDLSAFLHRDNGRTVNCSDCASIVSTYANMVGCDVGYNILTANFPLNYIRAIGTTTFTNDPFNRGTRGGFRYHAITGPVGRPLTFDATLVEDGDDTPSAAPFTDLVPDGLMRSRYLTQLSPAFLTVTRDDKTAIN